MSTTTFNIFMQYSADPTIVTVIYSYTSAAIAIVSLSELLTDSPLSLIPLLPKSLPCLHGQLAKSCPINMATNISFRILFMFVGHTFYVYMMFKNKLLKFLKAYSNFAAFSQFSSTSAELSSSVCIDFGYKFLYFSCTPSIRI